MDKNKIRRLEDHVLPEFPEPTFITIKNESEISLFVKACSIRERLHPDFETIHDNKNLTFSEKCEKMNQLYETINPVELTILTKDSEFLTIRLHNLLFDYFKHSFPKAATETIHSRIIWFMREMDKLATKEHIEDSEWRHNRDEDATDFDDFAWWERVNALSSQDFPEGIFTELSYDKLVIAIDERQSAAIRQYWIEHPEEQEQFMENITYGSKT